MNALCIYDVVDFQKTPILRDLNNIHTKFIWVGKDTRSYFLDNMNDFVI